jgi:hypothetical protein
MMMSKVATYWIKSIFIAATLLMVSGKFHAQERMWKVDQTISISAERAILDQLNNVYVLRKGEVIKLDAKGKELSRYSNKLIGEDVLLDVTNPLKVLLYSPEQMRLITLDSRFGEMNEQVNFFQSGYEQISLVATSHSNGMWLYDPIDLKLIRLNKSMDEERTSLNLAQLFKVNLYPTDLIEINNKVYMTDPNHGVFVFDNFGNYLRKIPIKGIRKVVISDDRLFYMNKESLRALNLLDSSEEIVTIEMNSKSYFSVNRNRIAITKKDGIIIYQALP